MNDIDNDFFQKGTMLALTEWIKINKSCYSLVDETQKVLASVFTSYDEADGDETLIWEVVLEEEPFGEYVSLYSAKLAVQKVIADWEEKQEKKAAKKKSTVKKRVKEKAVK